jgi:hypothetical protein
VQNIVMPRARFALSRVLRMKNPVSGNLKLPQQQGPLCFGDLPNELNDTYFGDTQCVIQPKTSTQYGGHRRHERSRAVNLHLHVKGNCTPAHLLAADSWRPCVQRVSTGA